jgi:hypothetical protein
VIETTVLDHIWMERVQKNLLRPQFDLVHFSSYKPLLTALNFPIRQIKDLLERGRKWR